MDQRVARSFLFENASDFLWMCQLIQHKQLLGLFQRIDQHLQPNWSNEDTWKQVRYHGLSKYNYH